MRLLANVKPDAVNALGYSWGGAVVLLAAMSGAPIDAAVSYYPACSVITGTRFVIGPFEVPTLALHGDADVSAPIQICEEIYAAKGLELVTFPGAGHAFNARGGIRYDEAATEEARRRVREFLRR